MFNSSTLSFLCFKRQLRKYSRVLLSYSLALAFLSNSYSYSYSCILWSYKSKRAYWVYHHVTKKSDSSHFHISLLWWTKCILSFGFLLRLEYLSLKKQRKIVGKNIFLSYFRVPIVYIFVLVSFCLHMFIEIPTTLSPKWIGVATSATNDLGGDSHFGKKKMI